MNRHTEPQAQAPIFVQRAAEMDAALLRAGRLRQQAWAKFWGQAGAALRHALQKSAPAPAPEVGAAGGAACRGC